MRKVLGYRTAILVLVLAIYGQSTAVPSSAAAQCFATLPQVTWTSPYAGWPGGLSADPRYFPIAVWLQSPWHAAEMANLGINLYVGNNISSDPLTRADLVTLKKHGISAIIGQDSVGLAHSNDRSVVGWWMDPDEPDNAQPNRLLGHGAPVNPEAIGTKYQSFKRTDPTRPILLGLGQGVAYDNWEGRGSNPPPESHYVPQADIVAFDIYPYNACGGDANRRAICGQFWLNALGVDRLRRWSQPHQAVWTWIETTAMDSVHGPTPIQTASEVWLSLIHGANGIGYFVDVFSPSFREDGIFENPAMVNSITALNKEIKALAPELNSASILGLVSVTSSNPGAPIDLMVKTDSSFLYIFSAIAGPGETTATFSIRGLSDTGTAETLDENRSIKVASGKFSDSFTANAVHIYKVRFGESACK